jgi:hypothetical protein
VGRQEFIGLVGVADGVRAQTVALGCICRRRSAAAKARLDPGRLIGPGGSAGSMLGKRSGGVHDTVCETAACGLLVGRLGGRRTALAQAEVAGSAGTGRAGQGRQAVDRRCATAREPLVAGGRKVGEYGGVWPRVPRPADTQLRARGVRRAVPLLARRRQDRRRSPRQQSPRPTTRSDDQAQGPSGPTAVRRRRIVFWYRTLLNKG